MQTKEVLDRIAKLRDNNPDFAQTIEQAFPEVVDNEPFINKNQLFLKRGYTDILYQLREDSDKYSIVNLKYDDSWSRSKSFRIKNKMSGYVVAGYKWLSKAEFNELLRKNGTSTKDITVINPSELKWFYDKVFNH